MLSRTPFEHILRRDKVPEKGTALQKQLEENSKILLEEVDSSYHPRRSVISRATLGGSLTLADHILKPDNYTLTSNTAPFYLGKHPLGLDTLPASAGVNFYFALITCQIYSQQNRLPELIDATSTKKIIIRQTYYNKFYWENENNEICYTCDQPNTSEHHNFMRAQAEWFMQLAYPVFLLQEQLKKILTDSESPWNKLTSWLAPQNNKAQEIYAKLSDYYLHIAYMEISKENAFFYFAKKAIEHYAHSTIDFVNSKLSSLISRDSDDVWCEISKKQSGPLKDCGIATKDYSTDASEAWKNAFNFAHKKIMDEGIPSFLHFMETDSARTSSEERSSDELHNPKEADSQITNIGLHRRHKGSNKTSNPLFQPQAPTT